VLAISGLCSRVRVRHPEACGRCWLNDSINQRSSSTEVMNCSVGIQDVELRRPPHIGFPCGYPSKPSAPPSPSPGAPSDVTR
jgi:hypothetical protein